MKYKLGFKCEEHDYDGKGPIQNCCKVCIEAKREYKKCEKRWKEIQENQRRLAESLDWWPK